eukprot:8219267-Alexandrium_andersonii.AAC.1
MDRASQMQAGAGNEGEQAQILTIGPEGQNKRTRCLMIHDFANSFDQLRFRHQCRLPASSGR